MNKTLAALLLIASPFAPDSTLADTPTPPCERTHSYLPVGWCQPAAADFTLEWLENKQDTPMPYHISDYINGDHHKDEVWILLDDQRKNWGVFAFLNQGGGQYRTIELDRFIIAEIHPQMVELHALKNDVYETACGKGYWKCRKNEPAKVTIKNDGFAYGPSGQGGSKIVFWRKDRFKKVSLDD
ncbi:hypothetical protein KFZ76_01920 [Methylovulum psychrotolerans]|uniref:hypothetical protein n=1 Tax=Methylovulum psychrotolerans TaxID=1704499 RepID=UPI001BFF0EBC|nr:hypothetical protein [Methylovulum psychrotolerans]MBT9096465.1 hypothetical protein [Methylovulum psychrotolerans]